MYPSLLRKMLTYSVTNTIIMRKNLLLRLPYLFTGLLGLLLVSTAGAQSSGNIDLSRDTVSKTNAIAARNTYLNSLRGHGNKATERLRIPVAKLKEIMDACAAANITDVSVMIITIRQNDLVHARKQNPGVSDEQLKGSQMLVFRVPRRAFAGKMGASIQVPSNKGLMLSLLGAGLLLLDSPFEELPWGEDDLYFGLGGICPPPTSCDTE